jgi:hypothetical protein
VAAHFVVRQLFQRRQIDFLDQPAVQTHLGVEHFVGQQGIRRGWRRRLRHGLGKCVPRNGVFRHALFNRGSELWCGNAMYGETTSHDFTFGAGFSLEHDLSKSRSPLFQIVL